VSLDKSYVIKNLGYSIGRGRPCKLWRRWGPGLEVGRGSPLEARPSPHEFPCRIDRSRSNHMGVGCRPIIEGCCARPLWKRRSWPPRKTPPARVTMPNLVVLAQTAWASRPPFKVTQGHWNRQYDFLLVINVNHGDISLCSEKNDNFSRKSQIFSTQCIQCSRRRDALEFFLTAVGSTKQYDAPIMVKGWRTIYAFV